MMTVSRFRCVFFVLCCAFFALAVPGEGAFAQNGTKSKNAPLEAPKKPDDLDLIDVGKVVEIKEADIIRLSSGKTYHMDQIRIPVIYNGAAIEYLKSFVLGRMVGVYAVKNQKIGAKDRYGYQYGHIMRDDATWVQADMVARGLAWAFSSETNRTLVLPLYKYEATARASQAGFWSDPTYDIKDKNNIGNYLNSYQIYQGVVTGRMIANDRYALVCDDAPRKTPPFIFTIRPDKMMLFQRSEQRMKMSELTSSWINTMVRLRGWIEKDALSPGNPAMIELTHPEQIEFLDPATGEAIR